MLPKIIHYTPALGAARGAGVGRQTAPYANEVAVDGGFPFTEGYACYRTGSVCPDAGQLHQLFFAVGQLAFVLLN